MCTSLQIYTFPSTFLHTCEKILHDTSSQSIKKGVLQDISLTGHLPYLTSSRSSRTCAPRCCSVLIQTESSYNPFNEQLMKVYLNVRINITETGRTFTVWARPNRFLPGIEFHTGMADNLSDAVHELRNSLNPQKVFLWC